MSSVDNLLLDFYADNGPERIGFILEDNTVVEVANVADDPLNASMPTTDDLIFFSERSIGTFHTHPGASSKLSADDYQAFMNWPDMKHYIIGNDGVSCYVVKGKAVVNA